MRYGEAIYLVHLILEKQHLFQLFWDLADVNIFINDIAYLTIDEEV